MLTTALPKKAEVTIAFECNTYHRDSKKPLHKNETMTHCV